jgi:hypothetical protein
LANENALVFMHPTRCRAHHPRFRPSLGDFLLDTTRAAIGLVTSGTVSRFPGIRFILSHGGGFVPYAAHRIAWLTEMFDDRYNDGGAEMSAEEILAGLARSTSTRPSSSGPSLLCSTSTTASLFYGSDWLYAGAAVAPFSRSTGHGDSRRSSGRTSQLGLLPTSPLCGASGRRLLDRTSVAAATGRLSPGCQVIGTSLL